MDTTEPTDYEMLMPSALEGHAPTIRRLTRLKNRQDCWFYILYHSPERMVDLLKLFADDVQVFTGHRDLPYILETMYVLEQAKNPLLIQYFIIFLFVELPSVRKLFRKHCSELMWVLAKPHLAHQCKLAVLKMSLMHTGDEEMEAWVTLCLQPLAMSLTALIVQRWDPAFMSYTFREQCGQVKLDEVERGDEYEPSLQNFATFRQISASQGVSLKRCMEVGSRTWEQTAQNYNSVAERISTKLSEELSCKFLTDVVSGDWDCERINLLSIPELVTAEMALTRPDRLGAQDFHDVKPPWRPGEDLESVVNNHNAYMDMILEVDAYRQRDQK
jgi:hypothetical protein